MQKASQNDYKNQSQVTENLNFTQKLSKREKVNLIEKVGVISSDEEILSILNSFFENTVHDLKYQLLNIHNHVFQIPVLSWLWLIHLTNTLVLN